MKKKWTVEGLMEFEDNLKDTFEKGEIRCPLHLSGGNERNLIYLFENIREEDYVIATHRNHFHYLLKGGDPTKLVDEILGLESGINKGKARSMNVCDPSINFYSTAIIAGGCAIACGIGLSLKKDSLIKKSDVEDIKELKKIDLSHIYCFIGDGAEDSGHFIEALRFTHARQLPITFIVEDNDYSTNSTKKDRWQNYSAISHENIIRYSYKRRFPHVGIGKRITF